MPATGSDSKAVQEMEMPQDESLTLPSSCHARSQPRVASKLSLTTIGEVRQETDSPTDPPDTSLIESPPDPDISTGGGIGVYLGDLEEEDDGPTVETGAPLLLDQPNSILHSRQRNCSDIFSSRYSVNINNNNNTLSKREVTLSAEVKAAEYQLVAPDGNWGWMVLLGSVIVNTLIPGLIKSFGVLFVEFLRVFDATPSEAAWIPGLTFALYNLLGPLASALSNRFSCRFTTFLGAFSAALGLALSYFANSIEYLYFSYGLLGGIGAGLSYTPGILIVGQYFERRRGFANGLCMSGSSLGSIILPPFLNYLLDLYGYRGAILIMCGVVLNVCVGAALYQPVEWHLRRVPLPDVDKKTPTEQTNGVNKTAPVAIPVRERKISWQVLYAEEKADAAEGSAVDEIGIMARSLENCESLERTNPLLLRLLRDADPSRLSRSARGPSPVDIGESELDVTGSLLVDGDSTYLPPNTSLAPTAMKRERSAAAVEAVSFGSRPSVYDSPQQPLSTTQLQPPRTPRLRRTISVTSTLSSSSFAYPSTIHHGGTVAAYQHTEVGQLGSMRDLPSTYAADANMLNRHSLAKKRSLWVRFWGHCQGVSALFDLSLLRNKVFLIITYSNVVSAIAYTNLLIVLPAHAESLGIGKAEYPLLLSVIAFSDLTGRIGGAWISDLGLFPRKYFFVGGLIISGVVMTCMPAATEFVPLAVCCSLFGLASGAYIGLCAVLLVDHLGADKLSSSFGLGLAINGIVMLGGPPTVGYIREQIGSYKPVLYILGIILVTGGVVWALEPMATRQEQRKEEQRKAKHTLV